MSNLGGAGPTTYALNRPAGTSMSISNNTMSLAIGQDTDNWYLQATTGPTEMGFVWNTLPFDDYRFSIYSTTAQQYAIQLKDSNNALVLQLADTSYNPGVATLIVPKTNLSFNLPYS